MTATLPRTRIDADDAAALVAALVALPSVNPAYDPLSPGEGSVVDALAAFGESLGLTVRTTEVLEGRSNVELTLRATRSVRRTLLIEAHSDTVGLPPGMSVPSAELRDGRLHGRGTCDVKGGLASALMAITALADEGGLASTDVTLLAAVDEEHAFRGIAHHLAAYPAPDVAIVLEPTSSRIVIGHNGVVRVELLVRGVAAHTSQAGHGVNAISVAMEVIGELRRHHEAGGIPGALVLTVTTIAGGSAINVVPAECRIGIDVRTAPDADADSVLSVLRDFAAAQRDAGRDVDVDAVLLVDTGMLTNPLSSFVREARSAFLEVGLDPETAVVPYGTDGSKIARLGVPTIVIGPGSIDHAHADDEWVAVHEVVDVARALTCIARRLDAVVDR